MSTGILADAHRLADEGQYEEALAAYRQALDRSESERADTLQWMALHLAYMGRLPEAVAMAREALELNPELPVARTALAVDYYRRDQFVPAEQELQRALRVDPLCWPALQGLAIIHASLRRHTEAEQLMKQVTALRPGSQIARAGLGQVQLAQGRWTAGVANLMSAIRLRPMNAWIYPIAIAAPITAAVWALVRLGAWAWLLPIALIVLPVVGPSSASVPVGVILSAVIGVYVLALVVESTLAPPGYRPTHPPWGAILYFVSVSIVYWLLIWIGSMV